MPKKLKLGTSVTWDTGNSVSDSGWGSSSTVGGDSSAFYGETSVNTLEPSRFHAARANSQVHNDWGGGWGEPAPDFSQDSFPTLGGAPQTSGKRQEPSAQSKAKYTKPNFADLIYSEPAPAKPQYTMQSPSRPLRPTSSRPTSSRPADPSPRTMNFTPSTPVAPYKPTAPLPAAKTRKLDSLDTSPMLRPPAYTMPTPAPYSLPTAAPITMPPPKAVQSIPPSFQSTLSSTSQAKRQAEEELERRADEIVERLHVQMASTSNRSTLRFIITNGDIKIEQIH